MKVFTYGDLRNYLLQHAESEKYTKLAEFIKKEISTDPNFDIYQYLYDNGDKVIFTAKDDEALIKKRDEYVKTKFKIMHFGLVDEIKSKLKDRELRYP